MARGDISRVKLTKGYAEKCEKLNRIHTIANNYLYLDDMKKRNFHNCLWEIAQVLEVDLDEFGKEYIEDEKNW